MTKVFDNSVKPDAVSPRVFSKLRRSNQEIETDSDDGANLDGDVDIEEPPLSVGCGADADDDTQDTEAGK